MYRYRWGLVILGVAVGLVVIFGAIWLVNKSDNSPVDISESFVPVPQATESETAATVRPSEGRIASATPTPRTTEAPSKPDNQPNPGSRAACLETVDVEHPEVHALLNDLRVGQHEGYDRVVFEFDAAAPGYQVEYVDKAIEDGSGNLVKLDGKAILQVVFFSADAHDEVGEATVPEVIATSFPGLIQVVRTGDYEGYVTYVMDLNNLADFRVSEDGPKVIIDIAQPGHRLDDCGRR